MDRVPTNSKKDVAKPRDVRKGLGQPLPDPAERLVMLQNAYEGGDEWAWVAAVTLCAWERMPMPAWVAADWIHRSSAAMGCRVDTWDKVLPRIKPRGRRRRSMELDLLYGSAVQTAVKWARLSGRSIDDGLFEELCAEWAFPFGPDKAKKLYYEMRRNRHWTRHMEMTAAYLYASHKAPRRQPTSTKRRK